jgi:DNA-binding YbaB/EbfC family protein
MGNMLRQAMEVKEKMEAMKATLGEERAEGSAGGGMVKVTITGKFEVIDVSIEAEIINPEEKEVLETLVRAACNEAVHKIQDRIKELMSQATGGIDIPGLTS